MALRTPTRLRFKGLRPKLSPKEYVYMVVSINKGTPIYTPQNIISHIMGTPKMVLLIFGNPHIYIYIYTYINLGIPAGLWVRG